MAILQDKTKPTYEELLAEIAKLKAKKSGPTMAWAKDKEQVAVNLTFPGKRSRYLEVEELTWIIENAESVLEDLTSMMEG